MASTAVTGRTCEVDPMPSCCMDHAAEQVERQAQAHAAIEHKATWFVWAGGEKMRRTSSMRGMWGYDVTCSCGWESRTGGATERSVREALRRHRAGLI